MAVGEEWRRSEVEAAVDAYFAMLVAELEGVPFVKLHRNRNLQSQLDGRSIGSIEFKHGNISAVLLENGIPALTGYKPYSNVQGLLRTVVQERLDNADQLRTALATHLALPVERGRVQSILDILTPPPERDESAGYPGVARDLVVGPRHGVNWLEREAQNRATGLEGEKLVLEFEEARLRALGRRALANRIEHVSLSRGDGCGFDILSFEGSGKERYIEVKSTRFSKHSPFFVSKNELTVSADLHDAFHLYRVFSLTKRPGLFQLPGSLYDSCILEPESFRATARGSAA
jgi:hypothetical protein